MDDLNLYMPRWFHGTDATHHFPDGRISYGQTIVWHTRDGLKMQVTIGGCESPEQAMVEAIVDAKSAGWTPRKWWQWWRWGDKDYV